MRVLSLLYDNVLFFLFFALFFISASFLAPVFAVSVNVTNAPSTISSDQFTIYVNITGASAGQNYLRVDLYKDGTTNYFGETFNGQNWYSGSDGTQYYPVTIADDKSGSGVIQARIGNPTAHDYDGTGMYKLRVRRYTSSGNPASGDDMDSVQVAIAFPTLTDTPAPTPTPTKVPTPTPTAKSPTLTPTLKLITTPTIIKTSIAASYQSPTPHNSLSPTQSTIPVTKGVASSSAVLGTSIHISPTPTVKVVPTSVLIADASGNSFISLVTGLGIVGFVLVGSGILLIWWKWNAYQR